MDPYATPPGHTTNPTVPVYLDNMVYCACDACREARQRWADNQEPLITAFPHNDNEDHDHWQDTGGSD